MDRRRLLSLLWRQVSSPLVLILLFGAMVSFALGDWTDAGIILAIVTGSIVLVHVHAPRGGIPC